MEALYSWLFHNVGVFVVSLGSVLAVAFLLVGVFAVARQISRHLNARLAD